MKKILLIILFLTGITPVFKNNSLNLGCSQVYAQDMNGGELEEVFICQGTKVNTEQQGDWLIEYTCTLENEDGVATNPCVSICEETDVKLNPSDPSDPCIDPFTGENLCDSGDPDPNTEGGGGGGSGGSGSGGSNCGSGTTCPDGYYLDETTCQCEKEPCMISCPTGYERNEDICQCVKIPCTTICDSGSGYKLNAATCECELDPCFNKDLRHKKISDEVKNLIDQRKEWISPVGLGMAYYGNTFTIQEIEDGWGDINLDKYSLKITKLPDWYTPQLLFEEIRTNFSDFITGGNMLGTGVELMPYSTSDGTKWNSNNPVGAAMDFNNLMDTSTVICTEYNYNQMNWTFTTVTSADHQGHFVSGNRQFGIETNSDGSYSFYLRGADRLGQWLDYSANGLGTGQDYLFNYAADATWKNLMSTLEKFIKEKTGAVVEPFDKDKDYANRFEYNEDDCPE